MAELTVEVGDPKPSTICECCGQQSSNAYGFVYRDGDAYSVYHAAWSAGHPDIGVSLALDLGSWGEEASPCDRFRVGIQAWSTQEEIRFCFVDKEASPWTSNSMLNAAEAQVHPGAAEFLHIAEHVVSQDSRIAFFLNALNGRGHS